nr:MAG: hypothetical protein 2 [Tombusviridae sp.]
MPTRKSGSRTARRRAPRSSRRSRQNTPPGSTRIRYRELLRPVSAGTTLNLFCPGVTGLPHLDARAAMYEMYRLRGPVRIEYKTAAATTTAGEVIMGIDSDPQDTTLTYAGTAALSPKAITPVWRNATLVVPPGHAMKQKWLNTQTSAGSPVLSSGSGTYEIANWPYDSVAFGLQVTSTGPSDVSTGSIWVEYDIELSSPKAMDASAGMSAVPYTNGLPQGTATTISGTGASYCPVPVGQFWIACCTGSNKQAQLDNDDLAPGYTRVKTYTSTTLPLPSGYSLAGIWGNKSQFLLVDRAATASNNWVLGGTQGGWPSQTNDISGNVLFVVASSLAGLLRLVGKKTV